MILILTLEVATVPVLGGASSTNPHSVVLVMGSTKIFLKCRLVTGKRLSSIRSSNDFGYSLVPPGLL